MLLLSTKNRRVAVPPIHPNVKDLSGEFPRKAMTIALWDISYFSSNG